MYTCRHVEMSREREDAIQNQQEASVPISVPILLRSMTGVDAAPHSISSSHTRHLPCTCPLSPASHQTLSRHTLSHVTPLQCTVTLMSHITLLSHFTCHVQSHSLTVTRSMPLHLVSIVYPKTHDCKDKAKYKEAKSDNLQSIVKAV